VDAVAGTNTRIIKNAVMQEMACPGYDAKCPSKADSIISVTDSTVVTKSILFDG